MWKYISCVSTGQIYKNKSWIWLWTHCTFTIDTKHWDDSSINWIWIRGSASLHMDLCIVDYTELNVGLEKFPLWASSCSAKSSGSRSASNMRCSRASTVRYPDRKHTSSSVLIINTVIDRPFKIKSTTRHILDLLTFWSNFKHQGGFAVCWLAGSLVTVNGFHGVHQVILQLLPDGQNNTDDYQTRWSFMDALRPWTKQVVMVTHCATASSSSSIFLSRDVCRLLFSTEYSTKNASRTNATKILKDNRKWCAIMITQQVDIGDDNDLHPTVRP